MQRATRNVQRDVLHRSIYMRCASIRDGSAATRLGQTSRRFSRSGAWQHS
jgi:hypothetical protein